MKLGKPLIVVYIVLALFGCDASVYIGNFDANIDYRLRETIELKCEHIKELMSNNDVDNLKKLVGPEIQKSINKDNMLSYIPKEYFAEKWKKEHDFHIEGGLGHSLGRPVLKPNDYIIQSRAKGEGFVAIRLSRVKGDTMMTYFDWEKTNGNWILKSLYLSQLTVGGIRAGEHYKMALNNDHEGHIIEAALRIGVAQGLLVENNPGWKFDYRDSLIAKAKLIQVKSTGTVHLPKIVDSINTRPIIFRLSPIALNSKLVPLVEYKTSISINNVKELENENREINEKLSEVFDEDFGGFDTIAYNAWEGVPNGITPFNFFKFSQMNIHGRSKGH